MKHSWKYLLGSVLFGVAMLSACGKGGGGNSNPNGVAACAYDAYGNCIAGVGSAGYVGDGNWNGRLIIQNLVSFQQFAYENGMCTGQDCAYISGYLNVQISLNNGGCLPGPANFAISTYSQGYMGQSLARRGDAYMNPGNNGFMINYTSTNGGYGGYGAGGNPYYGYPQQQQVPGQTSLGTMQINTQFSDAAHSVLNVQIVYRGQQLASGQIYGYATYTPNMGNTAGYCAGAGGYGGGYGYGGTGYGYGYGGTGYGYGGSYGGGYYFSPFSKVRR